MTNAVTIKAPEGVPFIEIEREFDAPLQAVFRAHSDPELVRQWMGPNGYQMDIEVWEFTTGGRYRYRHTDGKGQEYAFNGVFHVVRENEFAIQTFEFELIPDVVALESITLSDVGGGRSKISIHSVYPTLESRDAMVASGMETGVVEGYARLEKVAAGL
jgi:uncharacterized protein YndB with AHSA1/START domain